MLAGQMSNQDEDEVEDELEALENELAGPLRLPDAPTALLPENLSEREREEKAKERAKARARARARERAAAAAPPVPLEA
jgi:charged multivesicular body protein 6